MLGHCDGILYSALLSNDLCNTRDISQVGSAEYQVTARDLHQNLTRTSDTDNSNSNNQSPVKISFRLFYLLTLSFVGKIKKKHFKKSSRTISENQFDLLIAGALGLSRFSARVDTLNIPRLHLPLPVCAAPAACLCLLNNIL